MTADEGLFLGENLLPLLLLAIGGAMVVGNGLALLRPPERPLEESDLRRAPRGRSLVMVLVGLVAVIAAAGKLAAG